MTGLDPQVALAARPRWASRVRVDGLGCWLWAGSLNGGGYGWAWDGQRVVLAHRAFYTHLVGPIPEGLQLDHLCRVRNCVNPAHLEPVTALENTRRAVAARPEAVECGAGHPRTAETVKLRRNGKPECIPCRRERQRAYDERCRARNVDRRRASEGAFQSAALAEMEAADAAERRQRIDQAQAERRARYDAPQDAA